MSSSFRLPRSFRPTILLLFLYCNGVSSNVASENSNAILENSNAIVPNSTRNSQNDKLGDVFESYIASDEFCDDVACKEEYERAGYPYEQIMDVLNKANIKQKVYEIRPHQRITAIFIPRIGDHAVPKHTKSKKILPEVNQYVSISGDILETTFRTSASMDFSNRAASPKCKENKTKVYPFKAKGIDGKEYFLTNVKTFQQRAEIIRCYDDGVTCGDASFEPETYTRRCRQLHERVFISSFPVGQNITIDTHNLRTFLIPSGCVCEKIRRVDLL